MSDEEESERLRQIAAERDLELELRVRKERSLVAARRAAGYTANLTMLAITVSFNVLIQITQRTGEPANRIAGTWCCFFFCWVVFVLPMGSFAGWLAHRIFYDTTISVRRMAIVFALIEVLTAFGWILVLSSH